MTDFVSHITIPLPSAIPMSYGVQSTAGPYGCFLQARGTIPERDLIDRASEHLGISRSCFMRRVLHDASCEVLGLEIMTVDEPKKVKKTPFGHY